MGDCKNHRLPQGTPWQLDWVPEVYCKSYADLTGLLALQGAWRSLIRAYREGRFDRLRGVAW
jgi:hypothetical protein